MPGGGGGGGNSNKSDANPRMKKNLFSEQWTFAHTYRALRETKMVEGGGRGGDVLHFQNCLQLKEFMNLLLHQEKEWFVLVCLINKPACNVQYFLFQQVRNGRRGGGQRGGGEEGRWGGGEEGRWGGGEEGRWGGGEEGRWGGGEEGRWGGGRVGRREEGGGKVGRRGQEF